jgi:hypothetical protein
MPGPCARSPSTRNGIEESVPWSQTVSRWPSSSTGFSPSPGVRANSASPKPSRPRTRRMTAPASPNPAAATSTSRLTAAASVVGVSIRTHPANSSSSASDEPTSVTFFPFRSDGRDLGSGTRACPTDSPRVGRLPPACPMPARAPSGKARAPIPPVTAQRADLRERPPHGRRSWARAANSFGISALECFETPEAGC